MALAGRSCRTRADRETIAFGEPLSRAEAVIEDEGERRRVPLRRRPLGAAAGTW